MKYYIDGLSSEDIIKTYKIKKQKDGKYKLYIIYLDESSEKNTIKYNLTEQEAIEYQNLLNNSMRRQMELFILLPNNLKDFEMIESFLSFHETFLFLSYFVILILHQNRFDKALIDTLLFTAFTQMSILYTNEMKKASSFEYMDDLDKYRYYLSNYEQFISIEIYPNMIDYKTQNELEACLNNISNHSKVKVNMLNPNLK